ncbi:aspartate ammonia-lyase [bacterium]|nr:aspartate ammonia-lyase [bacterium]
MIYRQESDSLGQKEVPAKAYYGIQTQRALENFPITGMPISHFPLLIKALALIKAAATQANMELGLIESELAHYIVQAAMDVASGAYDEHFPVDVIQGGAGTSTNMNANEVIANRALELMGREPGLYQYCHPLNHVNLSQSTNDVYPTALKIAAIWKMDKVLTALEYLQEAFRAKGQEFQHIIKIGRTQLQDAVPMTLGQEFEAYAITIGEDIAVLKAATDLIHENNMGATAIGTGLNTVVGYADLVRENLNRLTGLELRTAPNLVEATSDAGAFVQLSGVLKRIAVKLSHICNDLRLLSSGPRAGIGEIQLPAVQPGSSIMPGKVNPVIPEMVNQVCFQIIGNDITISMAASSSQLELNAFEPIIGYNLFFSLDILEKALNIFRERCVIGIRANEERCRELLDNSLALVTALVPIIGYDQAAQLAKIALSTGRKIREVALESGSLDQETLERILDPSTMTHPGAIPKKEG